MSWPPVRPRLSLCKPALKEQAAYEKLTQARLLNGHEHGIRQTWTGQACELRPTRRARQPASGEIWRLRPPSLPTNWQVFEALRKQAALSPNAKQTVTICKGEGVDGFLPRLRPQRPSESMSGKRKKNDPVGWGTVPQCGGKGKHCYLCFGSRKNASARFCDECGDYRCQRELLHMPQMPVLVEIPAR